MDDGRRRSPLCSRSRVFCFTFSTASPVIWIITLVVENAVNAIYPSRKGNARFLVAAAPWQLLERDALVLRLSFSLSLARCRRKATPSPKKSDFIPLSLS